MRHFLFIAALLVAFTSATPGHAQTPKWQKRADGLYVKWGNGPYEKLIPTPTTGTANTLIAPITSWSQVAAVLPDYLKPGALNNKQNVDVQTTIDNDQNAQINAARTLAQNAVSTTTYNTNRATDQTAIQAAATTANLAVRKSEYDFNRFDDNSKVAQANSNAGNAVTKADAALAAANQAKAAANTAASTSLYGYTRYASLPASLTVASLWKDIAPQTTEIPATQTLTGEHFEFLRRLGTRSEDYLLKRTVESNPTTFGVVKLADVNPNLANAGAWSDLNDYDMPPLDAVLTGRMMERFWRFGVSTEDRFNEIFTSLSGGPDGQGPALMTPEQRAKLATLNPISASVVRDYFRSGNEILFDKQNGEFYLNAAGINVIVRSYLNSLDGAASGKLLSYVGPNQSPVWVTPPAGTTAPTTTTPPSTTTAPTGGSTGFVVYSDSTQNRPNYGLMTDVAINNVGDLQTFLATAQTNKRGIMANAKFQLSQGIERKGAWNNVALTAPQGATITSPSTVVMVMTESQDLKRSCFDGITFESTNTGNGYPMVFSNELVSFQGLEFARCKFKAPGQGNYNAFGVIQYSTSSNSGGTSSGLYVHDCSFIDIPRMDMEILSQGYDQVRLTNVTISRNNFRKNSPNPNENHRMAVSLSGLITNILVNSNTSINAKDIHYEFVNVKYALALSNTAVSSLEDAVAYSVSDDGRNSTEKIYIQDGYHNTTSRPFQIYDAKDVHIKGGTYLAGRGIDMNARNCSFESMDVLIKNKFSVEALMQLGGSSSGNTINNNSISGIGSLAAGRFPNYETIVLRGGTSNNTVTNNRLGMAKNNETNPPYYTDGTVQNQGPATNTQSGNVVTKEQ